MSTAAASATASAPSRGRRTYWQFLDDTMNPIVVKELRQAVNSKIVVAILIIFLLVQLFAIGIYLLASGVQGRLDSVDARDGRTVFNILHIILLLTCMLFLPLYTAIRLAAERNAVNTDLLFVTTIRPWAIIFGKMFSAIILAIMIFTSCLPFLALTYYLRGIDWLSIIYVLALDFVAIVVSVQIMVFIAVIPCHIVFKAILGLMAFNQLFGIFYMVALFTSSMLFFPIFGPGVSMTSWEFWLANGAVLVSSIGFCGLLATWSVALLSPPSANRALPMRLYVVGLWVVGLAVAIGTSYVVNEWFPLLIWLWVMGIIALLYLMIGISERRELSPRVARTVPKFLPFRLVAFFFFDGAAGGVLFSVLTIALSGAAFFLAFQWLADGRLFRIPFGEQGWQVFWGLMILLIYAYAYAMSAVSLQRLFPGSIPYNFTWILMVFLVAIGTVVPLVISLLINLNRWNYDENYLIMATSPPSAAIAFFDFRASDEGKRYFFMIFAIGWSLIMTAINLRWFLGQLWRFAPPAPVLDAIVIDETPAAPAGGALP